jgi:DNA-binding Xre family transcriptional regulator
MVIEIDVKAIAQTRGLTNAFQLSKHTGLGYETAWQLWSKSTKAIRVKTLEVLCERLNANPADFFRVLSRKPILARVPEAKSGRKSERSESRKAE